MTGRMFTRILVGFDGSASATHALRLAHRLAADAGHGEVTALAVVPATRAETEGGRRRAEEATREELGRSYAEATAGADPDTSRLRIVEGRQVAETLAGYAEEHGFDLVVLGRHGTAGALHPHVGHITETLVRNERVAVLLAPEQR